MDAEFPALEPPLCSELKHLCKRLQEAYYELTEDLTPLRDDRCYYSQGDSYGPTDPSAGRRPFLRASLFSGVHCQWLDLDGPRVREGPCPEMGAEAWIDRVANQL